MHEKFATLCAGLMAVAFSGSALTIEDLAGKYEMTNDYGEVGYMCEADYLTFDGTENHNYVNDIKVTVDGDQLVFANWLTTTFYADVDLEARTVTIPVQTVTGSVGYSYTMCLFESTMFKDGDNPATFNVDEAKPIVLNINDDGSLSLWKTDSSLSTGGYWDYIAFWNWGANYGWITGIFKKTGDLVPDEDVEPILGTYNCDVFKGEWSCLWTNEWDPDKWNKFDIQTGEGIAEIGVDEGSFPVQISSLGDDEVQVSGLFWGGLSIHGIYDADTKVITFPDQLVWGGYHLANSSLCDVEAPTADDVKPATAVINEDGSVTMNYTLWAHLYNSDYTISQPYACFLDAEQQLTNSESAVNTIEMEEENIDGPAVYYNLQGMRVNEPVKGIYIVRKGNKAYKVMR